MTCFLAKIRFFSVLWIVLMLLIGGLVQVMSHG